VSELSKTLLNIDFSTIPHHPMKSSIGFDPREIPWTSNAGQWPALNTEALTLEHLTQLFKQPPAWTPELQKEPAIGMRSPHAAAVLIPIIDRSAQGIEPHVMMTLRSPNLSSHAGQIAFPGGKVDASDASIEHAALREAEEEVGLTANCVRVIGALPPYVTGTSFHITPVIGWVSSNFVIRPNPHEVDDVFEVPLAFLMNPDNHRFHQWERDGVVRHWYSMPYVEHQNVPQGRPAGHFKERFIWGATAAMIRNLYRFLLASNSL
jgi:8-oxo-dGTP pyrophosphatase MutT (NUDIX family)